MLKALKVTMIVYGVETILLGLAFIFIPRQFGEMMGYEQGPDYILFVLAGLGVCLIAPSVFLIAAARDPIRHIYWVKFAILWTILTIVIALYSFIQGYVDFGKVAMDIILEAVFLVAFLVFYPWRAAKEAS